MKYASLLLILFVMLGSWRAINRAEAISELVHVGIQEDLKRVISEYIVENLPESKEFKFERLWTELTSETQVKATFIYSFNDSGNDTGNARIRIEGYAILNRELNSGESVDVWSFDELYILNNHVIFEEGITIKSDGSDEL